MHARLDLEIHLRDQFVAVRAVNWDVLEDDVVGVDYFGTFSRLLEVFLVRL